MPNWLRFNEFNDVEHLESDIRPDVLVSLLEDTIEADTEPPLPSIPNDPSPVNIPKVSSSTTFLSSNDIDTTIGYIFLSSIIEANHLIDILQNLKNEC